MQSQPPPFNGHADPLSPLFEVFAVIVKQREVVDVAQVALRPQHFLAEVIQTVEIDVREELAGQVADGQAAAAFQRRQEIVARGQQVDRLLRVGAVDDPVGEGQGRLAGPAPKVALQDLVIDGGRVAVYVATRNMAVAVAGFLVSRDGALRSLAQPVGVAVVNEAALPSLPARCGRNDAKTEQRPRFAPRRSGSDGAKSGLQARGFKGC